MKKVTDINLNGKAYKVEEGGYAALHTYLEEANKALSHDLDRTEILTDLEQSIAEKCERYVTDAKNVVTEAEIAKILEAMGPVETNEDDDAAESVPQTFTLGKHLYRIRDGSMVAGVSTGVGAYFGVETWIVRTIFILLIVFTSGFWLIPYAIAAIYLKEAKTDTQLAEAYGRPITAQQVADQVREKATSPETVEQIGNVVTAVFRTIMRIIAVVAGIGFGVGTAAWVASLWIIGLGHVHLQGSLSHFNGVWQIVAVTGIYLAYALPLLLISRLFSRFAKGRQQRKRDTVSDVGIISVWGIVVISMISLVALNAAQVRDYVDSHEGYIDIGKSHICIDTDRCQTAENKLPGEIQKLYVD